MPDMPKIDIRPDYWEIVRSILKKHIPHYAVWAFGSRAKWTAKEYSDLDLAVITDKPLPLDVSASLSDEFSESDLPWKVDVVDWATTSESFRKIIERDKVVVQEGRQGLGMAGEWISMTMGEVTDWASGGTPPKANPAYWGGEIPWISASSMKTGRLYDSDRTLTDEGLEKGSRLATQGTILLLVRGSELHKRIPVGIAMRDVAFNQDVKALRARAPLDSKFLYYWLAGNESFLLGKVEHTGIGAGKLDTAVLKNLHILIPPLPEQRAIAHILGTLDDKIELNRRRNQTLEAMTRALFKDWFVDFGPVRAKMAGQEPYLPADLWQRFPDRLDNEGKPEGWDERPLDEVADFLNGLALQKFPATDHDDSLPVIKIAELRNGISAKSDRASREVPAKYIIKDGDFLFSWSGSLLAKFWTEDEGALNQHLFKVTSERYPMWFVSHWVHHHLEEFQAIAASKATTMGHIQRGHLKAAMTICPPDDVVERMGVVMAPLVEQAIQNELESRNLAQLRDTLLPKLISGELRIKDAERFLEAAL
ncbi:MAG: restriction endonuclease subunit S [Pseudomonadales bacterium]|nr:restriction endonuclease subunit S [Pseudomonadales bacterium]